MKKILFADDDPEIREVVRILLTREGYEVIEAVNGTEAVEKADSTVDLIILDVMMPGRSGVEACGEIRKNSSAPILFLTAKSQDRDKEAGFAAGGDDYLVKPFSSVELKARVKAMLRRYCEYNGRNNGLHGGRSEDGRDVNGERMIRLPGLDIYEDLEEVKKNGERVLLTDIEYRILLLLAENRKKTYTTQDIYEAVWKEPFLFSSNNTVMVHIRNLRKKLEDDPQNPRYIRNVWGKGYRID